MLQIFKTQEDKTLKELSINEFEQGSWFNLIKPTADEIKQVAAALNIDSDFLRDSLDSEERSRIELDDDKLLIITNIPMMEDENSFDTLPLGVILTPENIVTVSLKENRIISFFNQDTTKLFDTSNRTRFLFQILFRSTKFYLRYLEHINRHTDKIEVELRRTMKNKALFQLLDVQKSLVYFTTALKDNGRVLEKLSRFKKFAGFSNFMEYNEEIEDLMEDVIIENKQAVEMVEMHRNILESMMDAFASIISNNLNIVMKFLTSVTIILAIPTMVSSFWGMNVDVPMAHFHYAFLGILMFSLILVSVSNTSFRNVVRRHFDFDGISFEYSDVVHSYFARNGTSDDMPVFELHLEHSVSQALDDFSVNFNVIFSRHLRPPNTSEII